VKPEIRKKKQQKVNYADAVWGEKKEVGSIYGSYLGGTSGGRKTAYKIGGYQLPLGCEKGSGRREENLYLNNSWKKYLIAPRENERREDQDCFLSPEEREREVCRKEGLLANWQKTLSIRKTA